MGRYSREIYRLIMLPMIGRGQIRAIHAPWSGRLIYTCVSGESR